MMSLQPGHDSLVNRRWIVPVVACLSVVLTACGPRIQEAGPRTEIPRISESHVIMADGSSLPLRSWKPKARPEAVIVALHGFNDYSMAFEQPARYWASKGIATYAFDQRGFGATQHRGIWTNHETLANDASTVLGLIRDRYPGIPAYVLGNSMGAAVVMIADSKGLLASDGLLLVGPALRGRRHLGPLRSAALWLSARVFPSLTFEVKNLRVKPSDNKKMLRSLSRDPLVIKATRLDAVQGLVRAMDAALEAASHVRTRSLILYGTRDELVPQEGVAEAIAALPPDVGHRIAAYSTGWHMLLRDLKADIVHQDVAAWVSDPDAPLPSGADKAARALVNQHLTLQQDRPDPDPVQRRTNVSGHSS